ncbi:hypothetical protein ACOSP6_10905 [Tenacibaculum sp. MEBiC06402]|uniref:hypothetical protein n=1 Tax=unclassified Tenacibaculum TaxID=2635139 RepID=UPI003B992FFB
MELDKAIHIINSNGITAYEIYKKTGLNESGLRRVLNKEVSRPQRKTQEALIKIAAYIELNGNLNGFDLANKDVITTKPKSVLSQIDAEDILDYIIVNKERFRNEPKVDAVVALFSNFEQQRVLQEAYDKAAEVNKLIEELKKKNGV